jgi:hypothetical protein
LGHVLVKTQTVLGLLNQLRREFERLSLGRRSEELKTWIYKGHLVTQKNRQKGQRWLSSAKFRTKQGECSVMAYPPNFEGFESKKEAEEATAKFVREQIDKTGIANVHPFGFN